MIYERDNLQRLTGQKVIAIGTPPGAEHGSAMGIYCFLDTARSRNKHDFTCQSNRCNVHEFF